MEEEKKNKHKLLIFNSYISYKKTVYCKQFKKKIRNGYLKLYSNIIY